jgi:hypothetical protein
VRPRLNCGRWLGRDGSSWSDAADLGVLMNTRGLMELIVLLLGLGSFNRTARDPIRATAGRGNIDTLQSNASVGVGFGPTQRFVLSPRTQGKPDHQPS